MGLIPLSHAHRRCAESEIGGVRCQLQDNHHDLHAAKLGEGTCMTWRGNDVRYWRTQPAPPWLIDLPWAPGCHLQFTPRSDGAAEHVLTFARTGVG